MVSMMLTEGMNQPRVTFNKRLFVLGLSVYTVMLHNPAKSWAHKQVPLISLRKETAGQRTVWSSSEKRPPFFT